MRGLLAFGRGAVDAAAGRGVQALSRHQRIVGGCRMRPPTVRAAYTFSAAYGRVVAPLHAPGAQSRAGTRRGTSNLAITLAKGDVLRYEGLGISARDRV
jgi:hypothetical protein